MNPLPMYPKLTQENKIAGLETIDLLLLIVAYLFVFLLSKNLFLNLALVSGVYFFLLSYKKGKPPRYTQALVRFLIHPGSYTQAREVLI